jgi:hypothetical protein
MQVSIVAVVVTLTLMAPVGAALAQTSVTIPPPVVAPPIVVPPSGFGLGTPNPFPNTVPPGSTPPFQTGIANPFNNPHPMLPWGDGQIGGERYGQVIRYWKQHPQVVENVIFVAAVPEEEARPEAKPQEPPEVKPEGEPQGQPAAPPATIRATGQGAVEARAAKAPQPQSVTVPDSWIVETTRGYIHMPRWVLQEVGGGLYQWAWVGAWFQPR